MQNEDQATSTHREEYVRGYKDGFRSVQGKVIVPRAPLIGGIVGLSRYDQGFSDGVRDASR